MAMIWMNFLSLCMNMQNSKKVLLHNPLRRAQSSDTRGLPSAAGTDVTYLNINQTIRSLTVGQLRKDSKDDILVLGTPTSIQVYDVINNVDLFYRDVSLNSFFNSLSLPFLRD